MPVNLRNLLLGSYSYPHPEKTRLFQEAQDLAGVLSCVYAAPASVGCVVRENGRVRCGLAVCIEVRYRVDSGPEYDSYILLEHGSAFGVLVISRLRSKHVLYTTAPAIIRPIREDDTMEVTPVSSRADAMLAALEAAGMKKCEIEHRTKPPELDIMDSLDADDFDERFDKIATGRFDGDTGTEKPPVPEGPDASQ